MEFSVKFMNIVKVLMASISSKSSCIGTVKVSSTNSLRLI